MKLSSLTSYKNIVLQMHNIPDADTVSSAWVLQKYFERNNCKARIIYGGKMNITKPSLLMFIEALGIEVQMVHELSGADLLLTVDCQYGATNVEKFPCKKFAVIDHHISEIQENELCEINSTLGSCATLVYTMLLRENNIGSFIRDEKISTALYYGLYTDTNGLTETRHPFDRDLAETYHDKTLIKKLKNSNLTMPELSIVSNSLKKCDIIDNIGLFRAEPCDPNILGFSSDIAMQVDSLEACIVFSNVNDGIKLSIRSCNREIMANEIAAFLCDGFGGGGGNLEKAGGFLKNSEEYLISRLKEYLVAFDKIYAGKTKVDFASAPRYKKLQVPVGFAKCEDLFQPGTKITIRTLEGDVDKIAEDNIYFMIGIEGEVYPILREKFEKNYIALNDEYQEVFEYPPAIINRATGRKQPISRFSKICFANGEKVVRAKQVEKRTKVFTYWDTEKYYSGKPGDFLVANEGDLGDCYIVNERIFHKTYEPV